MAEELSTTTTDGNVFNFPMASKEQPPPRHVVGSRGGTIKSAPMGAQGEPRRERWATTQ